MLMRLAQERAFTNAVNKGFHPEGEIVNIDQKLLLAIGELVEAQNELRDGHDPTEVRYENTPAENVAELEAVADSGADLTDEQALKLGKPEGFAIELADAVIRILDLAAALNIDLQTWVVDKMAYNETRPHKHGKQF